MFNFIKKKLVPDIENPVSAMCKCGHKWSWHYISSNDNKCYSHEINGKHECPCKGYKE